MSVDKLKKIIKENINESDNDTYFNKLIAYVEANKNNPAILKGMHDVLQMIFEDAEEINFNLLDSTISYLRKNIK